MTLKESLKELSHHAYAIIGGTEVRSELLSILEKTHKIKSRGNSDFFDRTYTTFTIDDAREVKSTASMRPTTEAGQKIFVLTMNGITSEAQNALLKLLEEPPAYAHIFLIIPSAHLLLPTVKSRLSFIGENAGGATGSNAVSDDIAKVTKLFVASSPKERIEQIKSFMEQITKEKRPKQDALDLLNSIQETVHARGLKDKKNIEALEAVEIARTYMNDRAPSLKMLLEYVALSI